MRNLTAWPIEALTLIRWFQESRDHLPKDPFQLGPGRNVVDPPLLYGSIDRDIAAGPNNARAVPMIEDLDAIHRHVTGRSLLASRPLTAPAPVEPPRMSRARDPETSKRADGKMRKRIGRLKIAILKAYAEHPEGLSAKQCEALPRFERCGYSTIRKRVGELARMGLLRPTGREIDESEVYVLTEAAKAIPQIAAVLRQGTLCG